MVSMKSRGNSLATALGSTVNSALSLVLVAFFSIWGAAIGSFVAARIFTSLLLWFSLRQVAEGISQPYRMRWEWGCFVSLPPLV